MIDTTQRLILLRLRGGDTAQENVFRYLYRGGDTAHNTTYYSESGGDTAQENAFRYSHWGGDTTLLFQVLLFHHIGKTQSETILWQLDATKTEGTAMHPLSNINNYFQTWGLLQLLLRSLVR